MDRIFPRRDDLPCKTFKGLPSQLFIPPHWHAFSLTKSGCYVLNELLFYFSLPYSYWKDLPISRLKIFMASSYSFTFPPLPFSVPTPFPPLTFIFQDVFIGRKTYSFSSLIFLAKLNKPNSFCLQHKRQIVLSSDQHPALPCIWNSPFPGTGGHSCTEEFGGSASRVLSLCHPLPKQLLLSLCVPTLKSSTAAFSHPNVSSNKFGSVWYPNRWLVCPLTGSPTLL